METNIKEKKSIFSKLIDKLKNRFKGSVLYDMFIDEEAGKDVGYEDLTDPNANDKLGISIDDQIKINSEFATAFDKNSQRAKETVLKISPEPKENSFAEGLIVDEDELNHEKQEPKTHGDSGRERDD